MIIIFLSLLPFYHNSFDFSTVIVHSTTFDFYKFSKLDSEKPSKPSLIYKEESTFSMDFHFM